MIVRDRLIIQSVDDNFRPWLDLAFAEHQRYAWRCDADYRAFVGQKDHDVHPSWNRIPMMLEALQERYRKVVWIDADSIVVDQAVNIFDETNDFSALQMTRVLDSAKNFGRAQDLWNSGVLVVNNNEQAKQALDYVWMYRHENPRQWHTPELWELNWLLDFIDAYPSSIADLDLRFNWMPNYIGVGPESEAVIRSFHGIRHPERFELFKAEVERVYGE